MRRSQRGVTLIELMTVIVVMAILASIAVPSYRQYLLRSQRTDATTSLLRISAAQEKFYLQNNAYSEDLVAAQADGGLGIGNVSPDGRYDLEVELTDDDGFIARAEPRAGGGQTDDTKCTQFSITNSGVKAAEGASDANQSCWR